jgi:hypothetical protein
MRIQKSTILLVFLALLVLCGLIASIPPISQRLAYYFDQIQTRVYYTLFPQEKAVFVPQEQVDAVVQATLTAGAASATPMPTLTLVPETPQPTATPTLTPTALPSAFTIENAPYIDQHFGWNMCAPANLSMALTFWGWDGLAKDVAVALKPFEKDKNVMPYEMAAYVTEQTSLKVALRFGGTPALLKSLISAGFPVVIEKGTYIKETSTGKISWMGHYNYVIGYDDGTGEWVVNDSYYQKNYPVPYAKLEEEWRGFNYVFMVVYPSEQENRLFELLGSYADEQSAVKIAAQTASDEIATLEGTPLFHAWFNRGSSLKEMQDFGGAAAAYDKAWEVYATLPEKERPFRIVWYETGPYFAYFYTARYQDVINLADSTLENVREPYLEESFYWRAKAEAAIGQNDAAVKDLCTSLQYHPDFTPSVQFLTDLGATCP